MSITLLAAALICFRGDFHPLSDVCVSTWEVDTVIECGIGPTTARFYSTGPGWRDLVAELPVEWSGNGDVGNIPARNYGLPYADDVISRGDMEGCACVTRSVDPVAACAP